MGLIAIDTSMHQNMTNARINYGGQEGEPPLESNFENMLLASQLVEEIRKKPNHISITLTGTGLMELIKAIRLVLIQEAEIEKANSSNQEELITKKEVMENLNVSPTTLWLWEKRKYLVPVKIGRRVFYKHQDINKLMEGK